MVLEKAIIKKFFLVYLMILFGKCIVIAEGSVQASMKNGNLLDAVFCDVFVMENHKIKQLISYLMSRNASLKFE